MSVQPTSTTDIPSSRPRETLQVESQIRTLKYIHPAKPVRSLPALKYVAATFRRGVPCHQDVADWSDALAGPAEPQGICSCRRSRPCHYPKPRFLKPHLSVLELKWFP